MLKIEKAQRGAQQCQAAPSTSQAKSVSRFLDRVKMDMEDRKHRLKVFHSRMPDAKILTALAHLIFNLRFSSFSSPSAYLSIPSLQVK